MYFLNCSIAFKWNACDSSVDMQGFNSVAFREVAMSESVGGGKRSTESEREGDR
jgi:hypothetical protein